jgi:hypothetical protein
VVLIDVKKKKKKEERSRQSWWLPNIKSLGRAAHPPKEYHAWCFLQIACVQARRKGKNDIEDLTFSGTIMKHEILKDKDKLHYDCRQPCWFNKQEIK